MKTLQISDKQAREIYPSAIPALKTILESTYSKEFFSQKITDRVKTVDDAFDVLGIGTSDVYTTLDTTDERAYKQLKVIVKALNEGWEPNWKDEDEYKYYPWFYMDKGASGFCLHYVYYYYVGSAVGSRLCFKTRDLAQYAATQFLDIYKSFFTI